VDDRILWGHVALCSYRCKAHGHGHVVDKLTNVSYCIISWCCHKARMLS
jgi:hypothetical protein